MPALLALMLIVLLSAPAISQTVEPETPEVNLERANMTFVELAEQLQPTVVFIDVVKTISSPPTGMPIPPNDPFWDFFKDMVPPDRDWRARGFGSGFIIDPEGYIITNFHVVDSAQTIKVKLIDETELTATLVGADRKTDLALIKVETDKPLRAISFGDSDSLKVGEWVIAIGNPLGLSYSVTAGIVSAKGRVIGAGPYDDFIQTDASINPGNSGGPLINIRGEVVGVNTLIIQGGQNLGFAIPINMVSGVIEQIRTQGHVTRGWLGIEFRPVDNDEAAEMQLPSEGALIQNVVPGSPAEKAGMQSGDLLVEYGGQKVSPDELPRLVADSAVGDRVKVKVYRDGDEKTLNVRIGEMPPDTYEVATSTEIPWGMTVADVNKNLARNYGLRATGGVLITNVEPGSAAARAGVQTGDLILEVDRIKVIDVASLKAIIDRANRGEKLLFTIDRQGTRLSFNLTK